LEVLLKICIVLTSVLIWLLWRMGVSVIISKSLVVLVLPVALLNLLDVTFLRELNCLVVILLCMLVFVGNKAVFFLSEDVIKDTLVVSAGLHAHALEGVSTHLVFIFY
jgi:hypothetical protein